MTAGAEGFAGGPSLGLESLTKPGGTLNWMCALALVAGMGAVSPGPAADISRHDHVPPQPATELLKPVQDVTGFVCDAPQGVRLESTGPASWKLGGQMPGKSCLVVLRPDREAWDFSGFSYARIDLVNSGPGLVWIRGRLDNPGAKDWADSTATQAFILPGERATLGFAYPRSNEMNDSPPIFDLQSGKPNGHRTHWKQFDPAHVRACRLQISSTSTTLSLDQVRFSLAYPYGAEANAGLLELPYLDRFGQVRQVDWPGKLHAEEDLVLRRQEETEEQGADRGPAAFNQYGGWASGPQLEATGFFRTKKYKGKWWLVDPAGRLFFSHGANAVGFGQATPVAGREALFAWLPRPHDPLMEGARRGSEACFMIANLNRTFGAQWYEPARDRLHRRMRGWGLNTLGAWSERELVGDKRTPYTAILHIGNKHSLLGHGISDPFSKEFRERLDTGLRGILGTEGGDPWCIGVFIDNEIGWTHAFAREAFGLERQQPARREVIAWLKGKYGRVDELNVAWGTDFASWESVDSPPDMDETAGLKEDILGLRTMIAAGYYRTCRAAMREVLPHHLYLGSRMHNAPPEVVSEALKYVDVLSLNSYEPRSGAKVPAGADKPCMDTEFHFGAPDRGVPGVGLWPVGDQLQRSRAYVAYVVAGLLHPCIVGTHWFSYTDQSATGRPGENYQIGFVDVTDTPYPELTGACRALADRLYALRASTDEDLLDTLEWLWDEESGDRLSETSAVDDE